MLMIMMVEHPWELLPLRDVWKVLCIWFTKELICLIETQGEILHWMTPLEKTIKK